MADLASLFIKVDSKGVVTASKDLNKLTDDSKKTETATEGVTRSFSKLQAAVVALASSYALLKMAQYIKDTALLAARYETLGVVMRVVGNNAGYTGAQMDKFARGLQKSGIAMVESRNTLARMVQAQIDLTNSQKLARIAQDAAVIGNLNSSEAFEHMIYGLQTGHPRILRTIGLNVDFNASVKALAVSLGIKKDALNEAQIMQARVNAVVKAGVLIAGAYEAAMGTAGKKLTSFTRYVEDFKAKMGLAFGPATVTLVDAATEAMKDMQEQISRPEAQEALRDLSSQLAETIVKIGKDLPKAIETMTIAVNALASAFSTIVNIWTHPVWDKMDKFFGAMSDSAWQQGMMDAANKISPEFHKISESMDKFLSQYEKMQEILAKGTPIKLDFALEDPDKYFGEMKAELLVWEKEGFESIKKWYKWIETLAQEKMESISELEDEETRVFEENLAYRFVLLKKYYENIETAAQEKRDSDAEWEDQLLRSARETAAYQKKLADESNDYIDKLAEAASYYKDLIGFEETYHEKMIELIEAEAEARAKATGDDIAAAKWAAQEKGRLEQKLFENKTKYIDEGFGALASSFSDIANLYDKGSDAAKKWEEASKAMEIAQRAVAVVNAVAAIANQGLGDPYTAFARIAAMVATMGALLASIGESVGGGGGASTAPVLPKSTVLGAEAGTGSESVQNIYDLLEDNNAEECNALRDIYNEIQDLNQNITGLVTSIIKGVGGKGFGAINTQAGEWLGKAESIYLNLMGKFDKVALNLMGIFDKITFGFVGWIRGLVGGFLGSIFGGGGYANVTAAGIEFGEIDFGAIMEGADILARAFGKIHKHTEGGWFHSDKDEYWTEYEDLDEDVIRLLTNIFKNIGDSFVLLAEGLGVDAQAIYDYIIPLTQLDLKGMSAEEIDKAVMDFFSNITDTMAEDLFGDIIKQYQEVGEGLYETAVRLVMQKEIILEALKMTGNAFEGTAQEAVDFSQALIEIAGDFETLMDASTAYYDAFFTDAEKQTQLRKNLTGVFGDLDLELPGTRQGFRDLIEGLDLTTDSGMEMYVALLKLAEAAGIYYDTLEDNIKILEKNIKTIISVQRKLLGTTEIGAIEDIAKRYGLVFKTITEEWAQSIIDGFTSISTDEVIALAESLGVSVEDLTDDIMWLANHFDLLGDSLEKNIAVIIAAQRKLLGTTEIGAIEDIAKKYGLVFSTITEKWAQSIIDGFTSMSTDEVIALADSLGVSVDTLVNDILKLGNHFDLLGNKLTKIGNDIRTMLSNISSSFSAPGAPGTAAMLMTQIRGFQNIPMSEMTVENLLLMSELLTQWYHAATAEEQRKAQLINEESNLLQQVADRVASLVDQIDQVIQNIKYSALNISLPYQKAEIAKEDYWKLYSAAKTGGTEDIQKYIGFVQTYLQQMQTEHKSSQAYQDAYAMVMGKEGHLQEIQGMLEAGDYDERIYNELKQIHAGSTATQINLSGIQATFSELEGWILNALQTLEDINIILTINWGEFEGTVAEVMAMLLELVSVYGWDNVIVLEWVSNMAAWAAQDIERAIQIMEQIVGQSGGWNTVVTLTFIASIAQNLLTFTDAMKVLEYIAGATGWNSIATITFISNIPMGLFADLDAVATAAGWIASASGGWNSTATLTFLKNVAAGWGWENVAEILAAAGWIATAAGSWAADATITFISNIPMGLFADLDAVAEAAGWIASASGGWNSTATIAFLKSVGYNWNFENIDQILAAIGWVKQTAGSWTADATISFIAALMDRYGATINHINAWLDEMGITDSVVRREMEIQLMFKLVASGDIDAQEVADWCFLKAVEANLAEDWGVSVAALTQMMNLSKMFGVTNPAVLGEWTAETSQYGVNYTAAQGAQIFTDLYERFGVSFARGGIVNEPTYGVVGEAGYPEAVIPMMDGYSIPVKWLNGSSNQQTERPIDINLTIELDGKPLDIKIKSISSHEADKIRVSAERRNMGSQSIV